jgi:hypothetical protein
MPVEPLTDHPMALTLPAAGYGALWRIILHFWASGCRPLPEADFELRSVARAHPPVWRKHKATILRVFEDVRPELVAYHRRRESGQTGIKLAAYRGGSANAARLRRRALEQSTPVTPAILTATPMRAPIPAPPRAAAEVRVHNKFRPTLSRR